MKTKVAVKMKKVTNSSGEERFQASVPMRILFDKSFDVNSLQRDLKVMEQQYYSLIVSMRKIILLIRHSRAPGKVLFYWDLGDKIFSFEKAGSRRNLVLDGLTSHLARDLKVSRKVISRCRRFRTLYPERSMIDPHRSWYSYVKSFEKGYAQ